VAFATLPTPLPSAPENAIKNLTDVLLPSTVRTELESVKHLIVVAAGVIGTVPFSVLQPFSNDQYLVDRMSISYAPSIYDLFREVSPWKHELLPAVVVGDPDLGLIEGWDFPRLTGAKAEAKAVAKLINTRPLIGKEATLESVMSRLNGAKLLYFATHGVADAEASLDESFLALGGKQPGQGKWTMRQIEQIYYGGTELAVLSACQTGLGQVYDGGIMHLARTFQVAGVPRVVMSLWRVDDEATADLMVTFVRRLQDADSGVFPAEALRRAMVEVKRRRPAPRRWASFVLFGTPR
jgi:CHAT domain-containing protein